MGQMMEHSKKPEACRLDLKYNWLRFPKFSAPFVLLYCSDKGQSSLRLLQDLFSELLRTSEQLYFPFLFLNHARLI